MSAAPLATDDLHAWAEKIAPTLSTEEWHGIITGRPRNMGTFTDLEAGIKAIAAECWRVHPNNPQRKALLGYLDATCGEYRVEILHSDLVKVGCQVHTLAEWEQRWKAIARQNNVAKTEAARTLEWAQQRIAEIGGASC